MTTTTDISLITSCVTNSYVETGKPQTAQDVAESLSWPVSRVRKALNGAVDYKMVQTGTHGVYAIYYPTLSALREMILLLAK